MFLCKEIIFLKVENLSLLEIRGLILSIAKWISDVRSMVTAAINFLLK
jgi:hypothetical protein